MRGKATFARATQPAERTPKVASATTQRVDLSRLNAVRLIITILIGMGYASTMSVGAGTPEWLRSFGVDPSLYGLQLLFFLSGWLAFRSFEMGKSVKAMLFSRAQRNLPWVALYTLIVTGLLYPLLCDHNAPLIKGTADLALYFVKTVTLIQPGQPMPGALDGALYACLLQGSIWSLRIGAIAFLALGLIWTLRLRQPILLLGLAILGLGLQIGLDAWVTSQSDNPLEHFRASLFLGYPFILGAAIFGMREHLPKTGMGWGWLFAGLISVALLNWHVLPWNRMIQPIALLSYCALTMALIHSSFRWLQNWPNLVLPTYLGIWPITQTWLYFMPNLSVAELVSVSLATALLVALIFKGLADLLILSVHGRVQSA